MRRSGILMPITALPSPYGVGTLGRAAFDFVDLLAQAGQSLWQILPVGPTGYGDSPYQSVSSFAGSPYYIDLDLLVANGLLLPEEIGSGWGNNPAHVDYNLLFQKRFQVLAKAAARQNKADPAYRAFCEAHAHWLDDYALFMAIKEAHGQAAFTTWPTALRLRHPLALRKAHAQYAPRVEFWRCLQYFFFTQWNALKTYANARGIGLVGDIPIYVSDDSSDLWANPTLFRLGADSRPSMVAGVPPDAFSDDGQLWGNPLYDWKAHRQTRYAWWIARLRHAASLFDITRIDHFRGFASYYAIPAGSATARTGAWVKGPGNSFIRAIHRALPKMEIIAEDLGVLGADVDALLAYSGYPGMKVLQFAFAPGEDSAFLPHNHVRHCVVYTGTHDNTTSVAWTKEASLAETRFARAYLGLGPRQNLAEGLIRATMASVADTAIIPLPDWLGLGAEGRINHPSTLGTHNWSWRLLPGALGPELVTHIRQYTAQYGRLSPRQKMLDELAEKLAAQKLERESAAADKAELGHAP